MQATNNLTLIDLHACVQSSVSDVEERFLRTFTDAIQRGCKVRVTGNIVYVQVAESLWLAVARYGGLEVYQDPNGFSKVYYQVDYDSKLCEDLEVFVNSANLGALDGILHSIGR